MDCEYNIKEFEAVIQQLVDLDRQKIVYPITTDQSVILTSLDESPISLADYLYKLKEYSEQQNVQLFQGFSGENPETRAYKASSGLVLENNINDLQNQINNINTILGNVNEYQQNQNKSQNTITSIVEQLNNITNILSNLEYEYQITLFKTTNNINYVNDTIVYPEEPKIQNGEFTNGWDTNYNSYGKYIWIATSIVKVNSSGKTYGPWKVALLNTYKLEE